MFTGIVQGTATVVSIRKRADIVSYTVSFPNEALAGVVQGASISLNGCCLTVTGLPDSRHATFDLVPETLARTSFATISEGAIVNFERSLRFGDEVGGHILSGHVDFVAEVSSVEVLDKSCVVTFRCQAKWTKYLFTKGYVALNGTSLTLTHVDKGGGEFRVSLIPETLAKTTFGQVKLGTQINVEVDRSTQAIVETVERVVSEMGLSSPK
jgi:riboflavin synthase